MEFPIVLISLILVLGHAARACDITHECPNDEDLRWATDGKECHVFHNSCFLDNVNCHHKNNNDPQLKEVPKEQCQALCITQCPDDDNPVCGYYHEASITFANQCAMEAHICQTGMPLFAYGIGKCDEGSSVFKSK